MEKMEGIVMKNIKQRAKEYADRHKAAEIIGKVYGYERIYNAEMAAYERGATDQKAIEEEVTLTKYDAMTGKQLDREERFTSWYFQNAKGAPTFSDAIEWARKDVISKACDWLHLNLPNIEYTIKEPKPLRVSRGLLIDELKKAIEE